MIIYMQTKNFVLSITGPTGSGKSTVGKLVAKSFSRCVNIDTDHVKHMIVSGFFDDASLPAGGDFTEWELCGESIGLLAASFVNKGFNVVINGTMHHTAWPKISEFVTITKKIILITDIEENIKKDTGRIPQDIMGYRAVVEHREMFSASEFYKDWQTLNTTHQSITETVLAIRHLVL